ncbi:hypothetical protein CLOSBL3_11701 [Clostridiaceae bacterium BL-3]|nr:hypothetical protein CLOSBL3_11701 [Clostridiaceae bacterium BL-3]
MISSVLSEIINTDLESVKPLIYISTTLPIKYTVTTPYRAFSIPKTKQVSITMDKSKLIITLPTGLWAYLHMTLAIVSVPPTEDCLLKSIPTPIPVRTPPSRDDSKVSLVKGAVLLVNSTNIGMRRAPKAVFSTNFFPSVNNPMIKIGTLKKPIIIDFFMCSIDSSTIASPETPPGTILCGARKTFKAKEIKNNPNKITAKSHTFCFIPLSSYF